MKKILFLLLTSVLVSCTEQDLSNYFANNILYSLNVSSEHITASPIDENHSIKINTNTDWSAQASEEWIVLENDNGVTDSELNFTTKANLTADERVGTIGIYCFGKHKKDIIINQDKVDLKVSVDSIFCGSNNCEKNLAFETVGSWKVDSENNWIKISQKEGFGNAQISFAVDELMSSKDRIGTITLTDQASQNKKITILQKGKYLNVDIERLSFLASGENEETINIDTDGNIEIVCESWINYTNKDNTKIIVQAIENKTGKPMYGSLKIHLKDVMDFIPQEVPIFQAPILTTGEIVDLGLSVKWSSFNIGATDDDEIGNYYFYGERFDDSLNWYDLPLNKVPKLITNTIYDTANSYWGGHWRIPTEEEWRELINTCQVQTIDLPSPKIIDVFNEKTGYHYEMEITKSYKISNNGKYIILPIAGCWRHCSTINGNLFPSKLNNSCAYGINSFESINMPPRGLYLSNPIIIEESSISHIFEDYNYSALMYPYYFPIRPVWD